MISFSAERSRTNTKNDLYRHAPFAGSLAYRGYRNPCNNSLALVLYDPRGTGKSSALSCVRHFLKQLREAEQTAIETFNLWRFPGQENLPRAFLGEIQVILPAKFWKLDDLLGDFPKSVEGL